MFGSINKCPCCTQALARGGTCRETCPWMGQGPAVEAQSEPAAPSFATPREPRCNMATPPPPQSPESGGPGAEPGAARAVSSRSLCPGCSEYVCYDYPANPGSGENKQRGRPAHSHPFEEDVGVRVPGGSSGEGAVRGSGTVEPEVQKNRRVLGPDTLPDPD